MQEEKNIVEELVAELRCLNVSEATIIAKIEIVVHKKDKDKDKTKESDYKPAITRRLRFDHKLGMETCHLLEHQNSVEQRQSTTPCFSTNKRSDPRANVHCD